MAREGLYMYIKSNWNFGVSYQVSDYLNLSAQYLHGSEFSLTGHVAVNPNRPPLLGGKELAPVPMRLRGQSTLDLEQNNIKVIRKVLAADRFNIRKLNITDDTVNIVVTNSKFRSTAQAVGRVSSTLQRFTKNEIKYAIISLYSDGLITASYHIDLKKITKEQFDPNFNSSGTPSIIAVDLSSPQSIKSYQPFSWGVGPYITHRLFNPDLPLSWETGFEVAAAYQFSQHLTLSGNLRKSIIGNLTDNKRRSNSILPRVHSDWPLYDIAGQSGHIHELKLSYVKNLAPGLYGRAHGGLLEPFFAGIGGEILYKPAQSPVALGLDIHRVQKRAYDMQFDLLDYNITVGHLSLYYDAGGLFDIEINAGRYLAGDWGATTTISRKFASGWEVGGYATFTDVPFATFGEGSFDKAIYVTLPLDWIISSPNKSRRRLNLRPITRDGGANLASSRKLYSHIEQSQSVNFKREFGRL